MNVASQLEAASGQLGLWILLSNYMVKLCALAGHNKSLRCLRSMFPQTVYLTLGVLTVMVKGRVARSRWRTGGAQNSSLFSCFRACMFVSSVNSRSFRVAAAGVSGFCL